MNDELTMVRELRAGIPEPDAAAVDVARRRLRAAMADPKAVRRGGRRAIPAFAMPVVVALAVLAMVAGLAVAVPALRDRAARPAAPPEQPAGLSNAGKALQALGVEAQNQPDLGAPGDRVWYSRSVLAAADQGSVVSLGGLVGPGQPAETAPAEEQPIATRTVTETWTVMEGRQRAESHEIGEPLGLDPSVRDLGEEYRFDQPTPNSDAGDRPGAFGLGQDEITWADLERLPDDKDKLRDYLSDVEYRTDGGPMELWEPTVDLMKAPLHPQQRAAALFLLAETPGMELLGIRDGAEKLHGMVVSIPDGEHSVRLYFDPDTGAYLGSETRLVHADARLGAPAGAVVRYELLGPSGYVAELGERRKG